MPIRPPAERIRHKAGIQRLVSSPVFGLLTAEEGSHVDGVLWSLTGDCEKSLDLYEGYPDFYDKQEITVKDKAGKEIKAIVYIMTKDYMQNFNPPGRSYLTGILKGCRQNQIQTEPILKAARKPPVPGQTQKSQPKKRKAGQER